MRKITKHHLSSGYSKREEVFLEFNLPFKKGRVRAQPDGFGCGGGEAANLLIL